MSKIPLQNAEEVETIVIVLLGVLLLITLEPVSATQIVLGVILAALVVVFASVDLWEWRHPH